MATSDADLQEWRHKRKHNAGKQVKPVPLVKGFVAQVPNSNNRTARRSKAPPCGYRRTGFIFYLF
jgi:Tfp pilus assembly protein PilP